MNNTVISYIRTYTPAVAGLIIGGLVSWGLPVPSGTKELLTAVLSAVFIAAYYAAARYAEKRWPAMGWLLGSPKQPVYVSGTPAEDKPGYTPTLAMMSPGEGIATGGSATFGAGLTAGGGNVGWAGERGPESADPPGSSQNPTETGSAP